MTHNINIKPDRIYNVLLIRWCSDDIHTCVTVSLRYGPAVGLILIGLGTGGIKPNVSSFGADQFRADQVSVVLSTHSLVNMHLTVILNIGIYTVDVVNHLYGI